MMELSKEVIEKLKNARNNNEFCMILAESGYDVEEFEKSLPENFLESINSGAGHGGPMPNNRHTKVVCPQCHCADEEQFSVQILASMFSGYKKYRCKRCGQYFRVDMYTGELSRY